MLRQAILAMMFAFLSLPMAKGQTQVSEAEMKRVYEEVKTPYKYGLVMTGTDPTKMTDCPTIFRMAGKWYMYYFVFDGRGYETWMASSKDLLHWKTLGRLLSFSNSTDWDCNQKGGYIALPDPTWGGKYGVEKYQGKYWMSYFGSNTTGYEQGDLSIGIANTTGNPTVAHEWNRLPQPVLSPKDKDVSWWDNDKIYKNSIWRDTRKLTGHPFVMYYNAKGNAERIGMAVSDDMVHWKRYGKDPVLNHGNRGITGDAYLQRMGNLWVMFYFGSNWSAATKGKAWNSFACSYDLVHWTDWTGKPIVEASEPYDNKYAHKSCVIKWNGVVYHYYCSVDKNGNRGIALATSKDLGKSTLQYPTNSLSEVFDHPESVTLGTYWYWVSNNISPEGAAEDIRAMKKAGVNLAFLSNIGPSTWWNHNHPLGNVKFMSDGWWQTVKSAFKTATEEGVQLGLFNCAGWSQSGGPWIKPEQSMKILVATEMHLNGNRKHKKIVIPKPAEYSMTEMKAMLKDVAGDAQYTDQYADYFVDVRTLAFPVSEAFKKDTVFVAPTFSGLSKRGTAVMNMNTFRKRNLATVDASKVIDLTDKLQADGTLNWKMPKGNWVILRIGMTTNGVTNSPAVFEAIGLELDKMNRKYVQYHFDSYIGEVMKHIPANDLKCLKYAVLDSYEKGGQNFTDGMIEKFSARFGYDMTACLPMYFGYPINSKEYADHFLRQLRTYISDEICTEYVGGFRDVAHAHGLKIWLENYGHGGFSSEALKYGSLSDEVAGEFWLTGHNDEKRVAASCAHLYGKQLAWAESFTSDPRAHGPAFSRYPGILKKCADLAFTQGINSTILHVYIQQLANNDYPGVDAWFGTELNRKNTYWSHMDLFTDYLKRVGWMLRQGKSVNDVAYYYGETTPIMHPKRTPEIPDGFDFDDMNTEILMQRVCVENGRVVAPTGASYRALVLPETSVLSDSVMAKVDALRKAGATIVKGGTKEELAKVLGNPDCLLPDTKNLKYCHRHLDDGRDIYFIANLKDSVCHIQPEFRVAGKQAELWHPVSGEKYALKVWNGKNGETTIVPLSLQPYESVFVVFDKQGATKLNASSASVHGNVNAQVNAIANDAKWTTVKAEIKPFTVSFDSDDVHRGPSAPVVMSSFGDLSKSENPAIRYYSGKAVYQMNMNVTVLPATKIYLNLGKVGLMAKVWVNDQYVGGVWTAPYRLDVTDAIHKGNNKVRVEVVGTWWNRLVGDSMLPESEQRLKAYTISWKPTSKLMPYGLLEPIRLEYAK